MSTAAKVACVVVAALHLWFLVLEAFLWTTALGMKTFGTTPEVAASSASLAMNQGLYNGFLAAALVVAVVVKDRGLARAFGLFGAGCVVVAAVVGALTAKPEILLVQGLPGLIALVLIVRSSR
jgi:putative membrane protein